MIKYIYLYDEYSRNIHAWKFFFDTLLFFVAAPPVNDRSFPIWTKVNVNVAGTKMTTSVQTLTQGEFLDDIAMC